MERLELDLEKIIIIFFLYLNAFKDAPPPPI